MESTIWYKGTFGVYTQEELKLEYLSTLGNGKFELCNFLKWIEGHGFNRLN